MQNRIFGDLEEQISEIPMKEEQTLFDPSQIQEEYVFTGLDEKEIFFYREFFSLIDLSKKGYISTSDLKNALKAFDYYSLSNDLHIVLSQLETDG